MIRQGKLANINKDTGSWLWGSGAGFLSLYLRRKTGKRKRGGRKRRAGRKEAKSAKSLIKRKGRIRFQKMERKSAVGRRAGEQKGEQVQPCPVIL